MEYIGWINLAYDDVPLHGYEILPLQLRQLNKVSLKTCCKLVGTCTDKTAKVYIISLTEWK